MDEENDNNYSDEEYQMLNDYDGGSDSVNEDYSADIPTYDELDFEGRYYTYGSRDDYNEWRNAEIAATHNRPTCNRCSSPSDDLNDSNSSITALVLIVIVLAILYWLIF
ncbi:MAG: hypothetical protein PHR45_03395 [Muribaculaceae bacterium]|nr:hypothetical protein [Muribaculaceae bacterium]